MTISFYIFVLFLHEIKIIKRKNNSIKLTENNEIVNCTICLEDVDFTNYSEYIRLKCHKK